MEMLPFQQEACECFELKKIIEHDITTEKYVLTDNILRKRANLLDICCADSKRSCCFTKAYSRYIEGTGSIFTDKTEKEVEYVYNSLSNLTVDNDEYLKRIKSLNLRYFTPREVCRLMCFPETFEFPTLSDRQCYMLLGNSINIKVVAELIKLLK